MSRPIQEYLNSLVNKQRIYYLDLNNFLKKQDHQCSTCQQKVNYTCHNCSNSSRQLAGEITNLSEFNQLKGINVSNNQLTSLNFLNTLPNKDKLKGINLFGNQIKEVDFADLWTKFPNLEKVNLQNNPVSTKNLNNLTNQQFNQLVQGIKEQKIRVDSLKGTLLMDLLDYTQNLIKNGDNSQRQQAHQLQTILQNSSTKNEQQFTNSKLPWIIGGVAIVSLAVIVGYLWGKKKQQILDYE